jgi:hypothetical protein
MGKFPIDHYQISSAFVTNIINCHYPRNRCALYYGGCLPPTVEQYCRIMRMPVGPLASYVY